MQETRFEVREDLSDGIVYLVITDEHGNIVAVFAHFEKDENSIHDAAEQLAADPDCWKQWANNVEEWKLNDREMRDFIDSLNMMNVIAWNDWTEPTGVHINEHVTLGQGGMVALGVE